MRILPFCGILEGAWECLGASQRGRGGSTFTTTERGRGKYLLFIYIRAWQDRISSIGWLLSKRVAYNLANRDFGILRALGWLLRHGVQKKGVHKEHSKSYLLVLHYTISYKLLVKISRPLKTYLPTNLVRNVETR